MSEISAKEKYADIINHPHHVSKTRPQMSMHDRAGQFSPFAALTGYDETIKESSRATDARQKLSEDDLRVLDQKQQYLSSIIDRHPEITVTYFIPDERKDGGSYAVKSGQLIRIYGYERELKFHDGDLVRMDDVVDIQSPVFETMRNGD